MKAIDKHVVIISREWHKPEISIDVVSADPEASVHGAIAISVKLSDFLHALGAELDGVQLELEDAAERVIEKLKRHTVQVM